MGYVYLFFALVGVTGKSFFGKRLSREIKTFGGIVAVNAFRSFICALVGFVVVEISCGLTFPSLTAESALISFCSAIFTAAFGISWLYAYKNQAYVFLNVLTVFCSITTGVLDALFFGNRLTVWRVIGTAGILLSVCVMSFHNRKIKGKITTKGKIALIIGGLGLTLSDFMQKIWVNVTNASESVFTFYTYALSLPVQIAILFFVKRKKGAIPEGKIFLKKNFCDFLIASAALYLNFLMKTLAARYIDGTVMYPLLQGANLVSSAAIARFVYKEKTTAASAASVFSTLVFLAVMNL